MSSPVLSPAESPALSPAPTPARASPEADAEGAHAPPHPPLVLRPARDDDGDAVAAVIAACFAEYPGCFYEASEFPELARMGSAYAERGGAAWVVERQGRVVGSIAVFATRVPAVYEVTKVYLAAECRGRGTAAEMLDVAVAAAAARGARLVRLFTDTRFHTAHRFYARNGFRRLPGERFIADVSASWEYLYVRPLAAAEDDGVAP
jgi:putative acetyltransferase